MVDSFSLDYICKSFPDPKNAFSLQLDWEHFKILSDNGSTRLYEDRAQDKMLPFCEEHFGAFEDISVLELGPYEAYQSIALVNAGAKEVVSIEANPRNYLKCLIVKNYFQLDRVQFLLGDFAQYLGTSNKRFDFILAAGVLYHLSEPFRVLDWILEKTDAVGICTTYYDINKQTFNFTGNKKIVELPGIKPFVLYERKNPNHAIGTKHGVDESAWMFTLDDLLRYLDAKNFDVFLRNMPSHIDFGPRSQMFAKRRGK